MPEGSSGPPVVGRGWVAPGGVLGHGTLEVERTRRADELDVFLWRCDACEHELHRVAVSLSDITTELGPLFEAFWADEARRTCARCGAVLPRPA